MREFYVQADVVVELLLSTHRKANLEKCATLCYR